MFDLGTDGAMYDFVHGSYKATRLQHLGISFAGEAVWEHQAAVCEQGKNATKQQWVIVYVVYSVHYDE